jgi:putative tricarboxylic transport membrane protein
MFKNHSRRTFLKSAAAASIGSGSLLMRPAAARAEVYPARPITIVNPYAPGGYVDNISRALAPRLAKVFGQPVTVINTPGANGLLGHEYFLKQPDDGYVLLADAANFTALNILVQKAPFKIEDFWMINLPARDYTVLGTSVDNGRLKSLDDVIATLKKDPSSLSIGVQPASSDFVNLIILARAAGIATDKLRLVTFDGGNPTRTAVVGGIVDIGLAGGEGFLPLVDQFRPLLTFDDERREPFKAPSVREVNVGTPIEAVPGSLRGFAVHRTFKEKYPDRYELVLSTYEKVFKDPATIAMLNNQQLASEWYGPEDSNKIYRRSFVEMQAHADLLKGV